MSNTKNNLKELMRKFTQINAGSGMEQPLIRAILEELDGHVDELYVGKRGNVYAKKVGSQPGHTLMLSAHMDQIGMVVKNILPNGYILFEKNGDIPNLLLQGRMVEVGEKNVPGVVGCKPGHLQPMEERAKTKTPEQSYIDLGLQSRQEVEALGIGIGDQIVWKSEFMEMANPDRICTKAIDNRISCALVVELLKNLDKNDFKGTIYGAFTVVEEVGIHGAAMAASHIQPDYAISLDTIPAGDTPDIMTEMMLPVYLGKGPGLSMADGVMNSIYYHVIHPAVRKIIEAEAEAAGVNLQKCTITGGMYATDASKLSYVGEGVPCAVLTTPRRYSHSPVEVMDFNDAEGVYKILIGAAKNNAERDLSFLA